MWSYYNWACHDGASHQQPSKQESSIFLFPTILFNNGLSTPCADCVFNLLRLANRQCHSKTSTTSSVHLLQGGLVVDTVVLQDSGARKIQITMQQRWWHIDYHVQCVSPTYDTRLAAHISILQVYQRMIDRGWRRSGEHTLSMKLVWNRFAQSHIGEYCYKPDLKISCCPQYTIK